MLAPLVPDSGRAALLFDPQTAGGLLAAVPGNVASELTDKLKAAGYPAAIIGKVTKGYGQVTLA